MQKTKDKPGVQEDRTFRDHFENNGPTDKDGLSPLIQQLNKTSLIDAKSAVTTDTLHPIIAINIDLDSKSITSVDKLYEFANGEISYELVITGNGGKNKTIYRQGTDTPEGTPLSVDNFTIITGLYQSIFNSFVTAGKEILQTRQQDGLKLRTAKCDYKFAAPPHGISATNRAFIKEVTIPMYLKMRSSYSSTFDKETVQKNVWNVKGAIFASTQAAVEGGYGKEAAFNKAKANGNYWGIGGASHFVNTGATTSEEAFAYWLDYLSKGYKKTKDKKTVRDGQGWADAVKYFESGDFTVDKLNKALRSGRFGGTYSYNTDPNADATYYKDKDKKSKADYLNYAGKIIDTDMMKPFILRFAAVLLEEINALATDTSTDAKYKSSLYESIRCELGDFLANDYDDLVTSKGEYDAN